jgi:hypothetical protein
MDRHLSEDQLTRHVYRTLTDAQREMMDIHLGTCQECRASLAGHEALHRQVRYSIMDGRRRVSMSSQASFADIAPRLRRSRKFTTFWRDSRQFVVSLATLTVLVVLTIGLALYFQDISRSDIDGTIMESMYKGGPQRTGVYNVKGPKHGELLWQFTTKSTMWAAPAVVDDVAYVGARTAFFTRWTATPERKCGSLMPAARCFLRRPSPTVPSISGAGVLEVASIAVVAVQAQTIISTPWTARPARRSGGLR